MMKQKMISLMMILAILLSFCACGGAMEESKDDANYNDGDMNGGIGNMPSDGDEPLGDDFVTEDRFETFVENQFIKTETENVSTFSADVDTAAYSYFRKLVQAGYSLSELIATAGDSIRTEEMVNYFDYGYTGPADDSPFATHMQIAPCPWNEDAALLVLGLQAKQLEQASKNNLVFLVDVSGSMASGDKLPLLKRAFTYLVDRLDANDTVSIVTYSGAERVVLESCSGNKKEMILNAVNSLEASGSTNGEAGLKKAYQLAEANYIAGGNNRILMASDGDLNVGISSTEELKNFISQKRESGVFLSVLGFGTGNYRDSMMETVADCGNGVYYYIDSDLEAEKIFGEDLFSTLYTVAKDVKLQLTFNQNYVDSYRLVGYENRLLANEDFEDDTKDAGEVGAGHSLTVCYELILTDSAPKATEAWMTLGVRYKAPDAAKSEEKNYFFGKEEYTDTPNDNFKFVSAVIETSMILHKSKFLGGITLTDVMETLDGIDLTKDVYKAQFKELIDSLIP